MALLTPKQLEQLRQIIEDASTSVAISTVGHEVTPEELQRLVDEGWVDPDQIDDVVLTGYQYGNLLSKLPQAEQMTFPEFAGHLEKNPIKLSSAEKHAVKTAQTRAGQYCTGLGSRYNDKADRFIIQADQQLAIDTRNAIRDKVSTKIAERTTRKKLAQDLGKLTGDWARDWQRIANTETHMAQQEGYLEDVRERHGDDELLAKVPEPNACPHCKRLYLDAEGQPLVKPASWWAEQGASNAGRKTAEWLPVLGGIHPWCQCKLIRIPDGWELKGEFPDWDLVPEGMDKSQASEILTGGRGDCLPDSDFDARDLADGIEHELEHVNAKDRAIAKEIAKDHLAEDPDYYRKLKQIEKARKLHGRRRFQGFDISIENRKGSVRHWYDKHTDTEGQTKMVYPYGYIRLTEGMDGDHVDVFIGPDESADSVYVVHQRKAPDFKTPDEDKVMMGFPSAKEAKAAYLAHFDSPEFFGSMTTMGVEQFRRKVYRTRRKMIKARQLPLSLEKAGPASEPNTTPGYGAGFQPRVTAPVGTMGQHDRGAARTAGANVRDRRTGHTELWPPYQDRIGKKRKPRQLVRASEASDPVLAGVSQDQLVRAAERLDVRGLQQSTDWANKPKLDRIPELNREEARTDAGRENLETIRLIGDQRRKTAAGARLTLNPKLIRREQLS